MDPRELVAGLCDPRAFPEGPSLRRGDDVDVRETHISLVFLTGERAYKIKKTIALWGFLDYSTVEKRRFYCEEEVRLNRRLAPDVYLGVVPVVRRDGLLAVGGPGDVVDHAVVMRRVPDDATLAHRIGEGRASPDDAREVARLFAAFHARAERGPDVQRVATPRTFARILRQNVRATRAAVPDVFPPAMHAALSRGLAARLRSSRGTLARRRREGRAVEGHGDLRAEHVVRVGGPDRPRLAVLDAIEFTPLLRCIDPLSDVAFLAMDLESLGRRDLAEAFLSTYLHERPDPDAPALLPLYLAYRAHVRAKVAAHRATDRDTTDAVRAAARADARCRLALAWSYAAPEPLLLLVTGLSGSGKSVLARAVAPWLRADVVASDVVRKRLAGLATTARVDGAAQERLYGQGMSGRTYEALAVAARARLSAGRTVVLDATWLDRASRSRAVAVARELGCASAIVAISVDDETARGRIERRAREGGDPSDATWPVYLEQRAKAQPVRDDEADTVLRVVSPSAPDDVLMGLLDAVAGRSTDTLQ